MYPIIFLSLGVYCLTTFVTQVSEEIGANIHTGKYGWRTFAVIGATILLPPGSLPGQERTYVILLGAIICWKYFTTDFDLGVHKREVLYRILLLITFILSCFDFAFVLLFIFIAIQWLNAWEHHAMLILRTLKINYSLFVVLSIWSFLGIAPNDMIITGSFLFLNSLVIACHYFRPGIDKIVLGKSLTAWVMKNDTHHLIMSAYNWGWARFIPERHVIAFTRFIASFVPVLNFFVLAFELSPVFMLALQGYFVIVLIGLAAIQLIIFLLTGINFWENVVSLLIAAWIFAWLYRQDMIAWSGMDALIYAALLVITIYLIKVWAPWQLAWWDTPFAGRVNWYLIGCSGRRYRLSNRFMCPHERLYGHLHGYFLVKHGILHGHPPGAVYNFHLKNLVLATGGRLDELRALQATRGKKRYSPELSSRHLAYLTTFFSNYNRGKRKNILPLFLRWLKAPGGQFFYWGDCPEFRSQEKVRCIEIYYEEFFFTGTENVRLTVEKLAVIGDLG